MDRNSFLETIATLFTSLFAMFGIQSNYITRDLGILVLIGCVILLLMVIKNIYKGIK